MVLLVPEQGQHLPLLLGLSFRLVGRHFTRDPTDPTDAALAFGLSFLCSELTTCLQDPSLRIAREARSPTASLSSMCLPLSLCCPVALRVGTTFRFNTVERFSRKTGIQGTATGRDSDA